MGSLCSHAGQPFRYSSAPSSVMLLISSGMRHSIRRNTVMQKVRLIALLPSLGFVGCGHTHHSAHITSPSIEWHQAYYESGPLDGCQLFEERRWLIRDFTPSVADGNPVLGKDERPTFSTRHSQQSCLSRIFLHLLFPRHSRRMIARFDTIKVGSERISRRQHHSSPN